MIEPDGGAFQTLVLSCIGEGPVVHVMPLDLDWRDVPVLTPMPRVVRLTNESLIPARFTAALLRAGDSAWSVTPSEGEVPPEDQVELTVTACLNDALRCVLLSGKKRGNGTGCEEEERCGRCQQGRRSEQRMCRVCFDLSGDRGLLEQQRSLLFDNGETTAMPNLDLDNLSRIKRQKSRQRFLGRLLGFRTPLSELFFRHDVLFLRLCVTDAWTSLKCFSRHRLSFATSIVTRESQPRFLPRRFQDKLEIAILNGATRSIPVTAHGVGTTIMSDPPMLIPTAPGQYLHQCAGKRGE